MKQTEIESFLNKYSEERPKYKSLMEEGLSILKKEINSSSIKVHSFYSRIKSYDSCLDKIRNKNIKQPFDEIKDFVGLRVICLFLSDLERVEKVINEIFEVIEKEDKIHDSEKDVFGYMGMHFIVQLNGDKTHNSIPFEIQVRTIAQDAWASISHHLDYKTSSIREDLKKDFHALSGLFYVADTHFKYIEQDIM